MSEKEKDELMIDCCLLAGKLMIESGAETYRVEDTMSRMASTRNMAHVNSYVTPTGIFFSAGNEKQTRVIRINSRTTDLEKIALMNLLSRKLSAGELTLDEVFAELQTISKTNYMFPVSVQVLAAAVASACFLILFGGGWGDLPSAFIAGGAGLAIQLLIHEKTQVKFFSEFIASMLIGVLAMLSVGLGFGTDLDVIIIGSVMPLVPGLLLTNAVRDLMAGNFIAGLSKGAEALLTAFAIGAGIGLILSL
ncbi:threonine/serine exporter family protein [Chungangia koreensis]|uniref:Threonine/serine exporter family protein n=1 Tax=Chungangia koreensis TaxID=752657 RepID=A0ABV8X653_9LACT